MSATIDSRIVSMKFDNTDFEKGARTSLNTLAQISKALAFPGVSAGLSGVQKMMGGFHNSMRGMGGAVDGISGRFIALTTVAATAISSITSQALSAAGSFAKQASGLQAMREGFSEYELKLGSIQSILANTSGENLRDVTKALDQLNHYSDKTIYNFGEMVTNIKSFTVAGIDLDTSVASVKGLANVAALTGTNAGEAARATYQMAQAMSSGTVRLQDWISMEHAGGMAGKVFQDSLIRTAEVHGVNVDQMIKKNGSFRLSLQEDWLTADILTETLGQFAGAYSEADLAAMGYSQSQIKAIQKMQKEAEAAATDVKTFSALVSTLKEGLASGWATSWEMIFGNLKQSTELWTGVNNTIGTFIQNQAKARNEMLKEWRVEGGADAFFEGIGNIFEAILAIIKPIHAAFRELFPPTTADQLVRISEAFRDFTEKLIISQETADNIQSVFRAVFTVFKIGAVIVGAAVKYIAEFFGILIGGGGGSAILAIAGAIGDVISAIGGWLLEGDKLKDFFDAITNARNAVLEPLVGTIGKIVEAFVELFSGNTGGFFEKMGEAGSIFGGLIDLIQVRIEAIPGMLATAFGAIGSFLSNLGSSALEPIAAMFDNISGLFDGLKDKLSFGVEVSSGGIDEATSKIEKLGFVGEIVKNIWDGLVNAFQKIGEIAGPASSAIGEVFGTIVEKVSGFIEGLTFQEAIALLNTGFLLIIYKNFNSFIKSMGDISESFADIGKNLGGVLNELKGSLSTFQNALRAEMLKDIAIAIAILVGSLIALAFVPAEKIKSGLATLGILMAEITTAMVALSLSQRGFSMAALAPVMVAMAGAIAILAGAMLIMQKVDWETIGKTGAVLGGLVVAALALGAAGGSMALAAGGLVLLAPALLLFAGVIKVYSKFDLETIAKGLGFMVGAILAVALAVNTMTASIPGALGMLIVASAMVVLAKAVKVLGETDLWDLIKGVGALAIILPIIATTANAMIAALPGAAAMIVMAFSIEILAEAIKLLGEMKWQHLLLGLGGLIGIFAVIGVASAVLTPIIPAIAGLGLAIIVLGAGLALVGTGMFLFASGLAILATLGGAGAAALTATLLAIGAVLPVLAEQFGLAIIAFAKVIGDSGPVLIEAFSNIMNALFKSIEKNAGPMGKALSAMIKAALEVVRENAGPMIRTGFFVMRQFLKGVRDNMPEVTKLGFQALMAFLQGVNQRIERVAALGISILVNFMKGIRKNIDRVSGEAVKIIAKFIDGIRKNVDRVIKAGTSLLIAILTGIVKEAIRLFDAAAALIPVFLNGLAAGIDRNAGAIGAAAGNLIWAVVNALPAAAAGAVGSVAAHLKGMIMDGLARLDLTNLDGGKDWPGVPIRYFVHDDDEERKIRDKVRESMLRLQTEDLAKDLNLNPRVTPILDLTQFNREAAKMGSTFGTRSFKTDLVHDKALSVAQGRDDQLAAALALMERPVERKEIKFEQNNNSPKALSRVEIYRSTKNLFAFAKEELDN